MKLAELQTKFQDAVLGNGTRAILDSIKPSRRLDRAARFAVYAEAYRLRLAGFLSEDFPVLREAIGDEMFGELVVAYIEATLSHHPNARWYARQLPEFMQRTSPWRDRRAWIDLAAFERALGDAFDAPSGEACEIGALSALAAESWPRLWFDFQKSTILLTLSRGTLAAYEAAVAAPPPEPRADTDEPESVLVWRSLNQQVLYRPLDDSEALALNEATAGKTFGEICTLLAFRDGEAIAQRAADFLARWFGDGLIAGINTRPR